MSQESLEERVARLVAEPIEVVTYDPGWPEAFEREKRHLLEIVPSGIIRRVEHFGSTAVRGLAAKPVIDMLVEVSSLDDVRSRVVPLLEAEGYEYLWRPTFGDDGSPFYAWFIKRDPATGRRTHHIHMVEAGFREHWDRLVFRDYLRAHPGAVDEYAALKRTLAAEYPGDRAAYTRAKGEFIERVTTAARSAADETARSVDAFFDGYGASHAIFEALRAAVESLGPVELEVRKSQIAFRHARPFAWVWVPDRYLHGGHAPLVLSVALDRRDTSGRWKEIVEPSPGRFMHHLELFDGREVDADVLAFLAEARAKAASR